MYYLFSFFILQVCPYFYYAILVEDYMLTFFLRARRDDFLSAEITFNIKS